MQPKVLFFYQIDVAIHSFQGKSVVIAEQIRTEEAKWRERRGMFAGTGYVGSSAPSFCWRGLVKHPGLH